MEFLDEDDLKPTIQNLVEMWAMRLSYALIDACASSAELNKCNSESVVSGRLTEIQ